MKNIILLTALTFLSLCHCGQIDVLVDTRLGQLRGSRRDINGEPLFEFAGLPFAKPPDRFAKAEMVEPWVGIKDATKYGPSCTQTRMMLDLIDSTGFNIPNKEISEDCLTLQVYVPRDLKQGPSRSVMIWIHGGAYLVGQAMFYDGAHLAMKGDVVVVTINYRLGLFGFLSTEDSVVPGNNGLWDQRLAIQWVKENIESFGGNPESMTIFGESAGGGSVAMQSISPTNTGLFQRSIMQSGSMFSPWSLVPHPFQKTIKVGKAAGCAADTDISVTDKRSLIDCLRGKDAEELLNITATLYDFTSSDITLLANFGPVVDGDFIPDTPENMLSDGKSDSFKVFSNLDFMAGTTDSEGGIFCLGLYSLQEKFDFNLTEGVPIRVFCDKLASVFSKDLFDGSTAVADAICRHYTQDNIRDLDLATQGMRILDSFADVQMVAPTVKAIETHSSSKRATYQYIFSHVAEFDLLSSFYPPWVKGSGHGQELQFLFGLRAFYPESFNISAEEQTISDTVMELWSTFAKNGNPNPQGTSDWPTYTTEEKRYLNISSVAAYPHVGSKMYADRMQFWLETLSAKAKSRDEL